MNVASISAQLKGLIRLPSVSPFHLFALFGLAYVFVGWYSLVNWYKRDCQHRPLSDDQKKFFYYLVLFFNIPGLLIYYFMRPSTFEEIERWNRERELLDLELRYYRRELGKKEGAAKPRRRSGKSS